MQNQQKNAKILEHYIDLAKTDITPEESSESFENVDKKLDNTVNLIKYFVLTLQAVEKARATDQNLNFAIEMFGQALPINHLEQLKDRYLSTKNPSYIVQIDYRISNLRSVMKKFILKYKKIFGAQMPSYSY